MNRPLCNACNKNFAAPNYFRDGIRHWRSRCSICIRRGRNLLPQTPRWQSRGYKKKSQCDLCGFKARYSSQILVYHIDSNLNNATLSNLRSICLNCVEVVKRNHATWIVGDLTPDY